MFDFTAARRHMVEGQIRSNDVTDLSVLKAFRQVARERFIPRGQRALAYGDAHIALREGRWVLRPCDFAKMVQAAKILPTDIVLDVACGRGYSTAVLAHLAETVIGLETEEDLVGIASDALMQAELTNAAIVQGALRDGAERHGPFNIIFINGAVDKVAPSWLSQLAQGGRMVCVVREQVIGRCCLYTRYGGTISQQILFDADIPFLKEFRPQPTFTF